VKIHHFVEEHHGQENSTAASAFGFGHPDNAIESAKMAIPLRPLPSSGRSQEKALAAQGLSVGIEFGDVQLEDLGANDAPSIRHKPDVQSSKLSRFEWHVLQLCTVARDDQPPVGESVEAMALDTALAPLIEAATELHDEVSPIEQRGRAAVFGSLEDDKRRVLFTANISDHHIRKATSIAIRIDYGNILPDNLVIVPYVVRKICSLG